MTYKYPFNAKLSVIEVLVLSCKPGQRRRLGWFCPPSSLRRTECYHRWESGRHRELRALISGTVVRTKPLCSAPSVKEMDWGKPVWRTRVPSTGRLVSLNCCRPQRQPISSQPLSCLTGLKGILQPYKTDPLQQNIRATLTFICDQNTESVSDSFSLESQKHKRDDFNEFLCSRLNWRRRFTETSSRGRHEGLTVNNSYDSWSLTCLSVKKTNCNYKMSVNEQTIR